MATPPASRPPRLALVGERSSTVRAHGRIPDLLLSAAVGPGEPVEPYWIATDTIAGPGDLERFDGIWLIPGSPYASLHGALAAVRAARTRRIPFLGTCGGFQHLLLEVARHVCGLGHAAHAEVNPDAPDPLIAPLACHLRGEEALVEVVPGTLAADAMGAGPATERFFCSYGLNRRYLEVLAAHGVVFSGHDADGDPRIAELRGHPWMVGALFQPELSSEATMVHPLIRAFVAATHRHVDAGQPSAVSR